MVLFLRVLVCGLSLRCRGVSLGLLLGVADVIRRTRQTRSPMVDVYRMHRQLSRSRAQHALACPRVSSSWLECVEDVGRG